MVRAFDLLNAARRQDGGQCSVSRSVAASPSLQLEDLQHEYNNLKLDESTTSSPDSSASSDSEDFSFTELSDHGHRFSAAESRRALSLSARIEDLQALFEKRQAEVKALRRAVQRAESLQGPKNAGARKKPLVRTSAASSPQGNMGKADQWLDARARAPAFVQRQHADATTWLCAALTASR